MTIQDKIQYNSFLLGLNDLYIPLSNNSFFINSPNIAIDKKIVMTGKTYVLVDVTGNTIIGFKTVTLSRVYSDSFNVIMQVEEKYSGAKLDVEFNFLKRETQCIWRLIDVDELRKKLDRLILDEYCKCE